MFNGSLDGLDIVGSVSSLTGFNYTTAGITTIGPLQTADLTGTGTLTLIDPDGATVTGTITGSDVTTVGAIGGTNSESIINLTNLTLVGGGLGTSALVEFYNQASSNGGIATLSFQFDTRLSLTDLAAANAVNEGTYSGVLAAAVPEPATVMSLLIGMPLLGLGAWARKRRAQS